jgi:outer membrane immunogenic protein
MEKPFRNSLLAAASALTIIAVSSGAAKGADPIVAGPDWTGFYIGANVGGGAVVNDIEIPPIGDLDFNGIGGEGVLGSVMIGYNHQVNNIVFGLQGEVGYNNLSTELSIGGTDIIEAQQGLVASLSARAGFLMTPETLAYIIGGYSYSEYETEISLGGPSTSFDETYDGYHVGGGLETMVGQHATVRVEYRYTAYNGEDWGTGGFIDVAPSIHTGTLGLAWNF